MLLRSHAQDTADRDFVDTTVEEDDPVVVRKAMDEYMAEIKALRGSHDEGK